MPPPTDPTSARVDKWLWCVRVFKMRAPATEACKAGHVTLNDSPIKPSREVRTGDRLQVRQGLVLRTLEVIGVPRSRIGPKQLALYCLDLTPASEWEKGRAQRVQQILARVKGLGRPTKRERREVDRFFGGGE